jgi:O-antigen ligase
MTSVALAIGLVPALIALVVAGVRSPTRSLVPFYAGLVPVGSGISLPGVPAPFDSLSSLVGLLTSGILLLHVIFGRRGATTVRPAAVAWVGFLALSAASLLWSTQASKTISDVTVLASLVLLYVLVTLLRSGPTDVKAFEVAVVVGGMVASGYALLQLASGSLPTSEAGAERFGRNLSGPNHTAASLVLPFAIAAGYALTSRSARERVPATCALVVLTLGITLTGSRAGLLAAAVVAVVATLAAGRRLALPAVLLGGAFCVWLALLFAPADLRARVLESDSSGRTNIWRIASDACPVYCATGSGWGTFPEVYTDVSLAAPSAHILRESAGYEAHNVWLLVLIEDGLLGMALVVTAFGLTFRDVRSIPRPRRAGALAGLVALLVTATFLSNLEFKYFWVVLLYVSVASDPAAVRPNAERVAVSTT